MEEYIFEIINYVSLETFIISLIIFILTMVIKIPIKKATSKLDETKRKAINSVIIIIPIILSIVINVVYFKILKLNWISINLIKDIFNSLIIALSIHAIYERVKIITKTFFQGKTEDTLLEETKTAIEQELNSLIISIQNNENIFKKTQDEITNLINLKNTIESDNESLNLTKLFETNLEIEILSKQKEEIKNKINQMKKQLENMEENKNYDI